MRVMIELIFNFSISISDKALCDVSEILNRHKESVNSISSSSKLDFSKGTSFSKNNVYKNYGNRDNNIMRFGKSDYMEVNSLADQRQAYYYDKPSIPFGFEESRGSAEVIETVRVDDDRQTSSSGKLEDFAGYHYPKPANPMVLPELPIKTSTTETVETFPEAMARSFSKP